MTQNHNDKERKKSLKTNPNVLLGLFSGGLRLVNAEGVSCSYFFLGGCAEKTDNDLQRPLLKHEGIINAK